MRCWNKMVKTDNLDEYCSLKVIQNYCDSNNCCDTCKLYDLCMYMNIEPGNLKLEYEEAKKELMKDV